MPLVWKIEPENSLVVAVAYGDVTRPEVDRYLDALVETGALAYRKVFDVHNGDTAMTADDLLPVAVRMRSLHGLGPMGPLAVVLPLGRGERLQRALGMVATARRPMRVFESPMLAYRWIAKQELPGVPTEDAEAPDTLEGSARARALARHIRQVARTAGDEAREMRQIPQEEEEVLYRGETDLTYRGAPLNICVSKAGHSWKFLCCDADRRTLGTLMVLPAEEIAACRAEGLDPLETTLKRIQGFVRAGSLAIPDIPGGAT
jgi:hypothetical protein